MASSSNITEEALHTQIAQFLDYALQDDGIFWTTVEVSNQQGGKTGKIKQAKLKAKGVKTGVPDILITYNPHIEHTSGTGVEPNHYILWLEVKSKTGRVKSDSAQDRRIMELRYKGHAVEIVRSVEDVENALRKHWMPFKARVM